MFQLAQPSGKTLSLSLQSPSLAHAVHAEQLTLQAICVHFGSGSWAQPWDAHAETYMSPQQNRWRICSETHVFVTRDSCIYTLHEATAHQHEAQPPWRQKWTSRKPHRASPETTSSLTSGRSTRGVARAGAWWPAYTSMLSAQIVGEIFNLYRAGFTKRFSPSFQTVRDPPKQSDRLMFCS